jgi:hypothetical protein
MGMNSVFCILSLSNYNQRVKPAEEPQLHWSITTDYELSSSVLPNIKEKKGERESYLHPIGPQVIRLKSLEFTSQLKHPSGERLPGAGKKACARVGYLKLETKAGITGSSSQ